MILRRSILWPSSNKPLCSSCKGKLQHGKSLSFSQPTHWKKTTPGNRQGHAAQPSHADNLTICCKICYEMVQSSPGSSSELSHISQQHSHTHTHTFLFFFCFKDIIKIHYISTISSYFIPNNDCFLSKPNFTIALSDLNITLFILFMHYSFKAVFWSVLICGLGNHLLISSCILTMA